MNTTVKDWLRDCTFSSISKRNAVGIASVYWWRATSHPAIDLDPKVEDWLKDNVAGKYRILFRTTFLSPRENPLDKKCTVYFSRVEDAIQFKLAFS